MTWRSLLTSVLVVICVGYGSLVDASDEIPRDVRADIEFLEALVGRDPENDARSAIRDGKMEFLGVASYTIIVPAGAEPDIRGCLKPADKVTVIDGTSDVIYGKKHGALIQQAAAYAARYNALIAKERGLSTTGGCRPSNIGVQQPPADAER